MNEHTGLRCVLAGTFLEGSEYIIGPFTSHDEAKAYSGAECEREKGVCPSQCHRTSRDLLMMTNDGGQ